MPAAEPVSATFQLLDNNGTTTTDVGSAVTMGTTATIFGANEDFTTAALGDQAPAPYNVDQGAYGSLGILENGSWLYALNTGGANYQALDLGQTATDPFTVQLANGDGTTATQQVTISVIGAGSGTLAAVNENDANPGGEFDPGDLHRHGCRGHHFQLGLHRDFEQSEFRGNMGVFHRRRHDLGRHTNEPHRHRCLGASGCGQ